MASNILQYLKDSFIFLREQVIMGWTYLSPQNKGVEEEGRFPSSSVDQETGVVEVRERGAKLPVTEKPPGAKHN